MKYIQADPSNYSDSSYRTGYDMIVWHTVGANATPEDVANWFKNPNANASAHFTVGLDGSIVQHIGIEDVSWANSNWEANCQSLTIECCDGGRPDDSVRPDILYQKTAELTAELVKKYMNGVVLVLGENVRLHREWAPNKTCPGNLDIDKLISLTNQITQMKDTELYNKVIKDIPDIANDSTITEENIFQGWFTQWGWVAIMNLFTADERNEVVGGKETPDIQRQSVRDWYILQEENVFNRTLSDSDFTLVKDLYIKK